jgi:hypothetical protein
MELQEKFLHHIWDQRHLVPNLKTINGKIVKIVYQGQYNTSNGPDFKHAVLDIGGETTQGDVEIHLKTYDWTAHQHHEDRAYNDTILHVVFEHKGNLGFTIREDAAQIDILELQGQIDADIAKIFTQFTINPPLKHQGICDFFSLCTDEQLLPLLQENGWDRFLRKCNRFNAELHFSSFDQLLYNGFMEAMGYDKNKFNTLSLSHQYTWSILSEWKSKGLDAITLAAIWLNYSDLMDRAEKLLPIDTFIKIKRAFEYQIFTNEKGNIQWNLFRVRPANHPVKRILQASRIIIELLDKGFLNTIISIMKNTNILNYRQFLQGLKQALTVQEKIIEGVEPLGNNLLTTMAGNIMLPILYLYAEKINDKELMVNIRSLYYNFPAAGNNYITGFMQGYMSTRQSAVGNASYINQQGLLNIYYKHCIYKLCDLCTQEKQIQLQRL